MTSEQQTETTRGRGHPLLLLPLLLVTVLCYLTKEFYPLSSFPMYSKFEPRDYYVYLQDSQGQPLASVPTFDAFSTVLKKDYSDELRKLKGSLKGSHHDWTAAQRGKAGAAVLDYWEQERFPQAFAGGKLEGARLVDVRIVRGEDGNISKQEAVIAVVGAGS